VLTSLLLASSLWVAAQEAGAKAPASAVVVSVPIEKISNSRATDFLFNGIGTGADLISTDWAINKGCVEGNPLVPRPEGRIGLKIGAMTIRASASYLLRRSGHKTTADIFRWAGFATDVLITGNNVACGLRK